MKILKFLSSCLKSIFSSSLSAQVVSIDDENYFILTEDGRVGAFDFNEENKPELYEQLLVTSCACEIVQAFSWNGDRKVKLIYQDNERWLIKEEDKKLGSSYGFLYHAPSSVKKGDVVGAAPLDYDKIVRFELVD